MKIRVMTILLLAGLVCACSSTDYRSRKKVTQQQSMNPYKFINIYKNGFKLGMKNVSGGWQIHLYATNQKRTIKEMYITIGKNYYPQTIKMRQSNGWTTIKVSNFKAKNLSDATFRFNSKDYPHAEIIDLR